MTISPRSLAALLASASLTLLTAEARAVEAATLVSVSVSAPVYDTRSSLPVGCPPAGCLPANTRDGSTSSESRWSCRPALDPSAGCTISYALGEEQYIEALQLALYKGDSRTRTIDISVDGAVFKAWTSSGETTGFETIELGVKGTVIDLHGVLADSDWLSISEVGIIVDDGNDNGGDVVEAGELGPVATRAEFYDQRLSDTVGCDPAGCSAALTRDGDTSPGSRWSCAPYLGGSCTIFYDLGAKRDLSELRLALYQGDTRVRTMQVSVDGVLATTWTSSGATTSFESIDLSGYSGELVSITGVQGDNEWLSIVETEIMVLSDDYAPPPSPTTATTPSPATPQPSSPPTAATPPPAPSTSTVNKCLDATHADYACKGGEDNGLYPPPDMIDFRNCGLTDADWDDVKECLVVAGDETDFPITTLILSGYNEITTVPEDLFTASPSLAATMTWLTLADTKITSIPAGLLAPLTKLGFLSLDTNQLSSIPEGAFDSLEELWGLFMTGNDLTELPDGIFDKLGALDWLHLQDNALTSLPTGVFDALSNLTELFLQENKLTYLPPGIFDNQVELVYLHLNDNELVTLSASLFEALGKLQELRLEDNPSLQCNPTSRAETSGVFSHDMPEYDACGCEVPDVTDNVCGDGVVCTPGGRGYTCGGVAAKNPCLDSASAFYRCNPTEDEPNTLDLGSCDFVDADGADLPACFENFGKSSIHTLYIHFHDRLTTLPANVFQGLDGLTYMDLSYTGLETLPEEGFAGLTAMEKMQIHFSSLKALPEGLFADMGMLKWLDISSSALTTLPAGVFAPLTSLEYLGLSTRFYNEAPLQCVPESIATEVDIHFQTPESAFEGTCQCEPAEAITCPDGTACLPGSQGYTCE